MIAGTMSQAGSGATKVIRSTMGTVAVCDFTFNSPSRSVRLIGVYVPPQVSPVGLGGAALLIDQYSSLPFESVNSGSMEEPVARPNCHFSHQNWLVTQATISNPKTTAGVYFRMRRRVAMRAL